MPLVTTAYDPIAQGLSLCKKHWRQLSIYALLLFLPAIVSSATGIIMTYLIAYTAAPPLATNLATLAVLVASGLFSLWVTIALSIKIKNLLDDKTDDNWKTLLSSTGPLIWPVLIISLLTGLIYSGPGLIFIIPAMIYQSWLFVLFGIMLLVFPGLMFFVWYFMSVYVVIFDKKTGRDALAQSKNLVTGRWWKMFANLFAILLTAFIIGFIIQYALSFPVSSLMENETAVTIIQSLISSLVSSLVTPFLLSAVIILYTSAKNNPTTPISTTPQV